MKKMNTPIIDVKKYGGKQVAFVRGRIVASGRTTREVLDQAKRRVRPKEHGKIWVFAVPKTLTFIFEFQTSRLFSLNAPTFRGC